MKKYISLLLGTGLLLSLAGCERELMDYEGTSSIYFDVQKGAAHLDPVTWPRQYFTSLSFLKIPEDSVVLELKMAFCGDVKDYDRPFKIEVVKDSTDAVEGTHFNLQRDWIMPGNATSTSVKMSVYKDEDYLEHPRRIMLQVVANEYFDANMTFEKLVGRYDLSAEEKLYQPDPRVHNILLKFQVEKPKSWSGVDNPEGTDYWPYPHEAGRYGAFSVKKYLLMLEVTGLTDDDFQDMPFSKQDVVCEIMSKYLEHQFSIKKPVVEEDGRLMWFSRVTKWASYQYEW